jgi:hypothetical protein
MADEKDDYAADIRFGEWLRSQRVRVGISLEESAKLALISVERLKGLEMGLSGRGITRPEAIRLSMAYRIEPSEIIERAERG